MSARLGLFLAALLALVSGFVAGWALRGSGFDVGAFEAVGTWVGALVSALAVVVALYLGYESRTQKRKREDQLEQDMAYTRHLLEGARRAQAGRVLMTATQIHQGESTVAPDNPHTVWTMILKIQNLGDETVHDFVCSVDPIERTAIRANPGREPTDVTSFYLQAGGEFGATFYVLLPPGFGGSEESLRPSLKFSDATGQRWNLDHHRRLTKVEE